jgi:hypothetical protein
MGYGNHKSFGSSRELKARLPKSGRFDASAGVRVKLSCSWALAVIGKYREPSDPAGRVLDRFLPSAITCDHEDLPGVKVILVHVESTDGH